MFEYSAGRWEVWQIEQISCNYNIYSLMQFVLHASGVDFVWVSFVYFLLSPTRRLNYPRGSARGAQRRGGAPLVPVIILHFTEACRRPAENVSGVRDDKAPGDGLLRADYTCVRAGAAWAGLKRRGGPLAVLT